MDDNELGGRGENSDRRSQFSWCNQPIMAMAWWPLGNVGGSGSHRLIMLIKSGAIVKITLISKIMVNSWKF
jgi:hypothetical protein